MPRTLLSLTALAVVLALVPMTGANAALDTEDDLTGIESLVDISAEAPGTEIALFDDEDEDDDDAISLFDDEDEEEDDEVDIDLGLTAPWDKE
jgi:hypothetical protein